MKLLVFIAILCLAFASCTSHNGDKFRTWSTYGGNKENNHYSSLTEIDTNNVAKLRVAWEYHTGDADKMTQIQVNPIIIDAVLYGVSAKLKLFALHAASGQQIWEFDPATNSAGVKDNDNYQFMLNVCRGLAYYSGSAKDKRIFYSASSRVYCIDAITGRPITSFGSDGHIDLHNDLGMNANKLYIAATSPGIVYKDLIILGARVNEDMPAAPGHIRAYDVHTGKLRWIFHTIPQPGEAGFDSWDDSTAYMHVGGVNAWSGFSLDEKRGIVYAPLGSAVYDFYGGKRLGNNLYANSLLALDANTGKQIWHFQTIHHDIWDRDLPTPPALVTITKDGKTIDAVAQPTKSGFIFLFDRLTGESIYPVVEKQVPSESELDGERPSRTQPFSPVIFARQSLTQQSLNNLVPDSSYQDIKKRLAGYSSGFIFNPPSKKGTVIFPGTDGGAEWGGAAVDPETGILYVNANEVPWVLTMVEAKDQRVKNETNLQAGQRLYTATCMACHGAQLRGGGNFPSLINLNKKYNVSQFVQLVSSGRRMMPAFDQLAESEKEALASFMLDVKSKQTKKFKAPANTDDTWNKMRYTSTGYNKFLTNEGYPAVAPPWGTLNAIELNTGRIVWKDTLGDYPEFKAKGIHTGTENYGGPVVTAGGLIFIAATSDSKIRAFNKRSGALLWEAELPACGFATPAMYEADGKQFLVIACGGGKLGKKTGDSYVAFALPNRK